MTEPTSSKFKERFPEFDLVDDSIINIYLQESVSMIGESWLEKHRCIAQMLLTAHELSLLGEPARSNALSQGKIFDNDVGSTTSMRDHDVEIEYADMSSNKANAGSTTTDFYKNTPYGLAYLRLLRRNIPSFCVV